MLRQFVVCFCTHQASDDATFSSNKNFPENFLASKVRMREEGLEAVVTSPNPNPQRNARENVAHPPWLTFSSYKSSKFF
jgi:hypothetical protein